MITSERLYMIHDDEHEQTQLSHSAMKLPATLVRSGHHEQDHHEYKLAATRSTNRFRDIDKQGQQQQQQQRRR